MLAATVAVAVVSALALPSLLGRKPVLIAASPVEARVVAAPEVVAKPAPLPAPPMPIVRAAAAAVPDAPKPPPLPAMTPSRPAPPILTLDMLPVLTLAEDDAEAPKPPPRRNAAAQRRPDPPLRQASP